MYLWKFSKYFKNHLHLHRRQNCPTLSVTARWAGPGPARAVGRAPASSSRDQDIDQAWVSWQPRPVPPSLHNTQGLLSLSTSTTRDT